VADWAPLAGVAAAEAATFARGLADPAKSQRRLLAKILAENVNCDFGRLHHFAEIDAFEAYCTRVPVRGYSEFAPQIERIAAGEAEVLTTAPVLAFEETGGTNGAKLIPYTQLGLADFRAAVLPWLGDLIARRPAITKGRAYVTVSPATRGLRTTAGGLSIGLGSDAAYLGEELAPAFAALLAVSPAVAALKDVGEWQLATLAGLIAAEDLSFVSLWSPTYLLALLGALEPKAEELLALLNSAQRRRLESALAARKLDTERLWPSLDCISCWCDGASAGYARQLGEMFPHSQIDPKGLLATEAAVTVPWRTLAGAVPAIGSCVIEFHDSTGQALLCDSLREGEVYRLVITTRSGLYRYDLGDRVECTGWAGAAPLLRFIGRAGVTSDLAGEKLDDGFVAAALTGLGVPALLVARTEPPGYVLMLQEPIERAGDQVEASLANNPHYAYARRIGQLAPLQLIHNPHLSAQLTRSGLERGQRMGDLKPVALVPAGSAAKDWLAL